MLKRIVTLGVFAASIAMSAVSFAADTKIGVVDMKEILSSAPQMKVINADLKKQFSSRKDAILSQAKTLQSDMANYGKNKAIMSSSKAATMKKKIASEEDQLRSEQVRYQQDLMAAQNKAMSGFLNRLKFSVNKVASKKGMTVVLPKNNLLYASSSTDITSSVLDSLK